MPYDLKQMQSLPLEAKIRMTQERIRQWYEYWDGQVYISFSGGKDSTVLKHIVDGMYDDVPSLFVNTGLEYPEIQKFVKDIKAGRWDCFNSDVEIIRPEMRFDEVIKKYGYPVVSKEVSNTISGAKNNIKKGKYSHRLCKLGVQQHEYGGLANEGAYNYEKSLNKSLYRQDKWRFLLDADFETSSYCCDVMKKKPSKQYEKETGRKAIIGTMAWESRHRRTAWLQHGCNAFESNRPTSQPLSFWTEQDILHYIKKYEVPYCSVYGEIKVKASDNECKGQTSLIDFLGCYEEEDILETTGCNRTGCIFCMFGCHLDKEPNRFQRLKQTHPRQYEYCINGGEMVDGQWQPSKEGLGLGKVLDYIGVEYE
jgi:3'-phosphoadenosine 5'-phosphosulfate sulfotransferase (PAPS reductase)/FAD synthetase